MLGADDGQNFNNGTGLQNISLLTYDVGFCQCADDDDGDSDEVADVGNDGPHVIPCAHPMAPKVGAR